MPVVTQKFQTTIPKDVRRKLGIKPGDKLVFFEDAPGRFLVMKEYNFINEIANLCKDITETIEENRKGFSKKMR